MAIFPVNGAVRRACARCTGNPEGGPERQRQLQLLALLEHRDALPTVLALRLAAELLVLVDHAPAFRCETAEEI
jgi:hypothetical protein